MTINFFGQWLLVRNMVTADELRAAINLQKTTNPSLGELGVEFGFFDEAEARSINLEQYRSDRRFGEVALEVGCINEEQLEQILKAQKERRVFLGEALIQVGCIGEEDLAQELELFKASQNESQQKIELSLQDVPHPAIVNPFIDLSVKQAMRILRVGSKVGGVQCQDYLESLPQMSCTQYIHGGAEGDFHYCLTGPEDMIRIIATTILQFTPETIDEIALDSMSEYVNIVTGNVCVELSKRQLDYQMQPPQLIPANSPLPPHQQSVTVQMASPEVDFSISLLFKNKA